MSGVFRGTHKGTSPRQTHLDGEEICLFSSLSLLPLTWSIKNSASVACLPGGCRRFGSAPETETETETHSYYPIRVREAGAATADATAALFCHTATQQRPPLYFLLASSSFFFFGQMIFFSYSFNVRTCVFCIISLLWRALSCASSARPKAAARAQDTHKEEATCN